MVFMRHAERSGHMIDAHAHAQNLLFDRGTVRA